VGHLAIDLDHFERNWNKDPLIEPGKRIELIRHVVTEGAVAGKSKPTTTPSGFVVWIESAK